MRLQRIMLAAATIVVALAALAYVNAASSCVSYNVTAPVVGNKNDRRCESTQFTHPFLWDNCPSVPPAGTYGCVAATVHTP